LYSPEQARRHEVKPGISGWAQVKGRNSLDWQQRFEYDVWYVDNYSLFLDIKIILLTLVKTLKKEGIAPEGGDSVMAPFRGNRKT
ncbi:MAG: sugar transferase, partial [Promethearchaeota archaeon]